jgi:hypothetical protein
MAGINHPSLLVSESIIPMKQLEPDAFLNELLKLFQKNKSNGAIYVTMKRGR